MIFTEGGGIAAIQRSIAEQRVFNAIARRKDRERSVSAYRGEQLDEDNVKDWLGRYIVRKENDIPYSMTRLTKAIVDKRSLTYKRPPERTYSFKTSNGTTEISSDYQNAIRTKDVSMKNMERYTNLLGVTAMRVILQDKVFSYRIINTFEPIFLHSNPYDPFAVQYLISTSSEPSSKITEERWAVWSPDFHFLVDGGGGRLPSKDQPNEFDENPFGIIPIPFAHAEEVIDDFWTSGMSDVVQANQMIDIAITDLNYITRAQAFGQMVVTGTSITGDELEYGYNKALIVEGIDVSATILDFKAKIGDIIESIKFQMELVAQNNNISTQWSIQGSPSGFSLLIQNIDLLEAREDDLDGWRKFENDLYQIERVMWEKDGNKALPENISVNYVDPEFPRSSSEQQTQDQWELDKGLISIVELYRRGNPDSGLDDKAIEELIIKNTTLNKSIAPTQPANAISRVFGTINTNNNQ